MNATLTQHEVVPVNRWIAARKDLLVKEKEMTRLREELSRERRELPWVKVTKNYIFDGPKGKQTLADLFDGRDELIVYHFMFGPGWKEGCVGCSFVSDHVDGARVHLENHGVSYAAVSRAPWAEIAPFQKRMGWGFHWVSSNESDFNYDFHVSFKPEEIATGQVYYNFEQRKFECEEMSGTSVFIKDANGDIYHTYSTYGRGGEMFLGTYAYLDAMPKGRDENGPRKNLSDWVRHHDRYGAGGHVAADGRYVAESKEGGGPCCHE